MKIVFVSNYYNHHQAPTALAWQRLCNGNFYFVSTSAVPEERIAMGYQKDDFPDFVILAYQNEENKRKSIDLINAADAVIIGSAPDEYIAERLKQKKLTFRCHERIYKDGITFKHLVSAMVKHYWRHKRHKNLHLLCCSAFTASDYAKTGCFKGKAYRWGYFPQLKYYDNVDGLISSKNKHSIIWVARFIDWKHPELAVTIAEKLKNEGYEFTLDMIGNGELLEKTRKDVSERGLSEYVKIHGAMKPEQVRQHMEKSEIHIFTSDRNEGWGAVLNESMNSACAVVASHAIGSVPFLLEDGVNGLIYQDGHIDDLYQKVKLLLDNKSLCALYGKRAYDTLLTKCQAIMCGDSQPNIFEDGPCSNVKSTI